MLVLVACHLLEHVTGCKFQKKIELRPHHKIVQQYIYVRSSISSLVVVWGSVR